MVSSQSNTLRCFKKTRFLHEAHWLGTKRRAYAKYRISSIFMITTDMTGSAIEPEENYSRRKTWTRVGK